MLKESRRYTIYQEFSVFIFMLINQTVSQNFNGNNHGNRILYNNIVRVIPVTVLIKPNNFLDKQQRTIQRLTQAIHS